MADIQAFKASFKGDIVLPGDAEYAKAIGRWSVTAVREAAIVAFVKDEADIALAIKYAKDAKLPIAIRSGGHNPAGASSIEGGLVIDLSRYFSGVRVDAEKKLGYVGGGALWETVDKEAIKHGLATVAGTVNHTGVGGLILGGGFGWLSGQYGLVIDNLVQVRIVTASGEALTANDTENPDLFWGIRGGGCNFGIVTEFVLKLYPQRATVYAGSLIFIPPQVEKLKEVTAEWFKNVSPKEAMLQIAVVGPDGNPALIALVFYNGSKEEGEAAFKAFLDIGPVANHTGEIPYEDVNALQNGQAFPGQGFYFKGTAPRLSTEGSKTAVLQRVHEITKDPSSAGIKPIVVYEYFPLNKINSVASDATAFPRRVAPSVVMLMAWDGDKDKELVNGKKRVQIAREAAYELSDIVTRGHDEFGLGYTNYDLDGEGSKEKAKIAFAENYPRMQKVKKQYDPELFFNKWFPITPA